MLEEKLEELLPRDLEDGKWVPITNILAEADGPPFSEEMVKKLYEHFGEDYSKLAYTTNPLSLLERKPVGACIKVLYPHGILEEIPSKPPRGSAPEKPSKYELKKQLTLGRVCALYGILKEK